MKKKKKRKNREGKKKYLTMVSKLVAGVSDGTGGGFWPGVVEWGIVGIPTGMSTFQEWGIVRNKVVCDAFLHICLEWDDQYGTYVAWLFHYYS